jgi:hypothetical protein
LRLQEQRGLLIALEDCCEILGSANPILGRVVAIIVSE